MADFFDKKEEIKTEEDQEEIEKVKVGDSEFTPEELEQLVGSGKRLKEIEEKQGQPVDDILKSWGQRGEVIGKYKELTKTERVEELEEKLKKELEEAERTPEQVDKEEVKKKVIAEAKEYGLLTKEEAQEMFNQVYEERRSGERMFSSVSKVLRQAKREGKPTTEAEKLLEFMADPSNPKDPEKAYKLMFESELDEWKQKQMSKAKGTEFITQDTSTAGAKQPVEKTPKNYEELKSALNEHLTAGE